MERANSLSLGPVARLLDSPGYPQAKADTPDEALAFERHTPMLPACDAVSLDTADAEPAPVAATAFVATRKSGAESRRHGRRKCALHD